MPNNTVKKQLQRKNFLWVFMLKIATNRKQRETKRPRKEKPIKKYFSKIIY